MNNIIKTAGVAGDPISHSLSPRLHGYWLKKYQINGEYKAFHVQADELHGFLKGLNQNNISGLNLTVPHKEKAMSFVDKVDDIAQKIGAVNTVYFDGQNNMIGTNTDGYGFLKHLKSSAPKWNSKQGAALIIGAGGAARAVIVSLLDDGVPEVKICNRTLARAENLKNEINDHRIKTIKWEDRSKSLSNISLLVNVTTLGMKGQAELELSLDHLPLSAVVYDIVYNPIETKLLKAARLKGNVTVDGLGMLLHQAAPGFKAWFGIEPEIDDELSAYMLKAL